MTLLEAYLHELERHLKGASPSRRSEIILSVRAEILEALKEQPETDVSRILERIGEPRVLARQRLEQGAPRSSSVSQETSWSAPSGNPAATDSGARRKQSAKWLRRIGFMMAAMSLLTGVVIFFLIRKYSPLYSYDDPTGRLTVLGGAIELDPESGSMRFGSTYLQSDTENKIFAGKHEVAAGAKLEFRFGSGQIRIETGNDGQAGFHCRYEGDRVQPQFKSVQSTLLLDLSRLEKTDCRLTIPAESEFRITGTSGRMEFESPRIHVDAELANGEIMLSPSKDDLYLYRLSVKNGVVDHFDSPDSASPPSRKLPYRFTAEVKNGRIGHR